MFESCIKDDWTLAQCAKSDLQTPLHVAAEFGQLWFARELIEKYQSEINCQCNYAKYSPLMYACQNGHKEVIEYLLETGKCNLDLKSFSDRDALKILVDAGFAELADLLLKKLIWNSLKI